MTYISSSAIRAVDYHWSSGRLTIYFHSSGGYTFYRVPVEVYNGLVSSSSPGSYYNSYIRGRYR